MQRKSGTPCSSTFSSVVVATPAATETTAVSGVDQLGGLAQHALDVDRLDRDQHHVGAAHELGVVGDVLHAEPLGQARRAARAAVGDEDALAQRRIGAQPALDHGAGHVAGADRAQDGRRVHASDGTCGRLASQREAVTASGTAAVTGLTTLAACLHRPRPGAASAAPCATSCAASCATCSSATASSAAATTARRRLHGRRSRGPDAARPRGAAALVPGPAERHGRGARVLRPLRLEPALARAGAPTFSVTAGTLDGDDRACASSSTSGTSSAPTGRPRRRPAAVPRGRGLVRSRAPRWWRAGVGAARRGGRRALPRRVWGESPAYRHNFGTLLAVLVAGSIRTYVRYTGRDGRSDA